MWDQARPICFLKHRAYPKGLFSNFVVESVHVTLFQKDSLSGKVYSQSDTICYIIFLGLGAGLGL